MRRTLSALALLVLAVPADAQTPAPIPALKLSGGLEATLPGGIGRDKNANNVTVSLQLENKGKAAVQIALVGPTPFAVDNAGTMYSMSQFSGAAACRELGAHYVPMCVLGEEVAGQKFPIPLQAFTQIDPGATATLTFGLNGRQGSGTLMSFSSVFAYRVIADPLKDDALPEPERRRQLRTMSVSFPPTPIAQQK